MATNSANAPPPPPTTSTSDSLERNRNFSNNNNNDEHLHLLALHLAQAATATGVGAGANLDDWRSADMVNFQALLLHLSNNNSNALNPSSVDLDPSHLDLNSFFIHMHQLQRDPLLHSASLPDVTPTAAATISAPPPGGGASLDTGGFLSGPDEMDMLTSMLPPPVVPSHYSSSDSLNMDLSHQHQQLHSFMSPFAMPTSTSLPDEFINEDHLLMTPLISPAMTPSIDFQRMNLHADVLTPLTSPALLPRPTDPALLPTSGTPQSLFTNPSTGSGTTSTTANSSLSNTPASAFAPTSLTSPNPYITSSSASHHAGRRTRTNPDSGSLKGSPYSLAQRKRASVATTSIAPAASGSSAVVSPRSSALPSPLLPSPTAPASVTTVSPTALWSTSVASASPPAATSSPAGALAPMTPAQMLNLSPAVPTAAPITTSTPSLPPPPSQAHAFAIPQQQSVGRRTSTPSLQQSGGIGTAPPASGGKSARPLMPIAIAPSPKISPSLKPLLPSGASSSSIEAVIKLAQKSNYQHILEGDTEKVGLQYSSDITSGVELRKTTHKQAEQRRRDSLKQCFDDLRNLLPNVTEKNPSKLHILRKCNKQAHITPNHTPQQQTLTLISTFVNGSTRLHRATPHAVSRRRSRDPRAPKRDPQASGRASDRGHRVAPAHALGRIAELHVGWRERRIVGLVARGVQ
ncbi:hypothetical protein BJ742DRAFT_832417 [Cladochytrium replicatum]|nr:hypothetical protein BJ742DRAFT_832417 [Cladochytrium replicatum]